jgi:hypothetical protein
LFDLRHHAFDHRSALNQWAKNRITAIYRRATRVILSDEIRKLDFGNLILTMILGLLAFVHRG